MKLVQKCNVALHVAQAAPACASSLFSQHANNPVIFQNRLNGSFSKAENLSLFFGDQVIGDEWQAALFCMAGNDEHHAKPTFSADFCLGAEYR